MARLMPKPSLKSLIVLSLVTACGRPDLPAREPAAEDDHVHTSGLVVEVVAGPAVEDPAAFTSLYVEGYRVGSDLGVQLSASLPAARLPATLTLGAVDLTMPGVLRGDWRLVARLDQDGFSPVTPGDVAGESLVSVGRDGGRATISLDRVLGRDDVQPESEPRFRGTLELDPAFAAADGTGVLFLNIKQSPDARGMPRASLRIERPSFPVRFDIGAEHVPLQVDNKADMLLGDLWFVARLDGDGNAMTKQAGDLSSEPIQVAAGGQPFSVTLDVPQQP